MPWRIWATVPGRQVVQIVYNNGFYNIEEDNALYDLYKKFRTFLCKISTDHCYHKNVDILNQAKPCKRIFKLIKDYERYSGTKASILINITMKPNITRSGCSNCLITTLGFIISRSNNALYDLYKNVSKDFQDN